jgi:acetoin utilization protein AcuB
MPKAQTTGKMLVADWMTRTPLTIPLEASLREAIASLRERGIRHLPVLNGGKLCGIISDRDIKSAIPPPIAGVPASDLSRAYDRPVCEIMTTELITVGPGDSIMEAARLMRRHKISGLPVVYNDHLVGILTETDLLDAFLSAGNEP